MRNEKIIIVDDESMVTSSLSTLLKIEGFKDVQAFNSPLEALDYIKNNEPSLILSDFMMPEQNGVEFLSEAKKLYPEVSMILLTGYADKENAIRAINEVGLYKYIEKPFDNDDLVMNIKNGIERSYLLSELREKIEELEVANKKLEKYSQNLEELVKEKTADLQETNSKLAGIIDYCADGIIIIDEKGYIKQANPTCENMVGLSEDNLKKMNFLNVIYTKEKTNFKQSLAENPVTFLRDCFILNSLRNKKIPVDISFALIETENKTDTKHFVGVIRDIRAQKEMERLRDDFIATLTHDMRTPLLASIQTLSFFIDGTLGKLTEKQNVLLSTMKVSNENLLGLVNGLLEVYKYESGKLNLCKTNFCLKDLIQQVYDELKVLADNKKITFNFNYNADDDLKIIADRGELRRVIMNLCGNAINYTNSDGEVTIELNKEENDIIFSVADNGNGIPEEDIPNLFKRFSQGTNKKRSTGTGLGLYLSRQIIEAHNGKIWLESKLNKGSQFSFLLTDAIVTEEKVMK